MSHLILLLASLITTEAGNQSYTEQMRVCDVVLNRTNNPHYPSSISSVILQRGQFKHFKHPTTSSIVVAKRCLDANYHPPNNYIYFTSHKGHNVFSSTTNFEKTKNDKKRNHPSLEKRSEKRLVKEQRKKDRIAKLSRREDS